MRHVVRWTCIALISLGGVAAAAVHEASGKTEASAERGADSLVSGSEQAVLEWALAMPSGQASEKMRRD
jgi:hypothetical protein